MAGQEDFTWLLQNTLGQLPCNDMKNWIVCLTNEDKQPTVVMFLHGTKDECRRHAQIMLDLLGLQHYSIKHFPKWKEAAANAHIDKLIDLFR